MLEGVSGVESSDSLCTTPGLPAALPGQRSLLGHSLVWPLFGLTLGTLNSEASVWRWDFIINALPFVSFAHSSLTFQYPLRLPFPRRYSSKRCGCLRHILVLLMLVMILLLMLVSLLVVVMNRLALLALVQVLVVLMWVACVLVWCWWWR